MFPYWLLFGYFALGGLTGRGRLGPSDQFRSIAFTIGCIGVALMVGLRSEIGNDWFAYDRTFERMAFRDLGQVLGSADPGYMLLNWAVKSLDWPYWVVTMVGAIVFARGLFVFCKAQPEPWLAALVGIPYLTIVVAMGYNRQGIALGFLLMGLAGFVQGRPYIRFLGFAVLAALFHASAVVAIPLTVLSLRERDRIAQLAIAPAVIWYLYNFTLQDNVQHYLSNYTSAAMQSEGAAIRLALSFVPAILFFLFQRRLAFAEDEKSVWRNFALAAIGLSLLFFVFPSSTAIDRVALYVLPLQLAVFSRFSLLLDDRILGRTLVIFLSLAVQFVWLNYAAHAEQWIPYQMVVPFVG